MIIVIVLYCYLISLDKTDQRKPQLKSIHWTFTRSGPTSVFFYLIHQNNNNNNPYRLGSLIGFIFPQTLSLPLVLTLLTTTRIKLELETDSMVLAVTISLQDVTHQILQSLRFSCCYFKLGTILSVLFFNIYIHIQVNTVNI